jgi:hypothetical protein
MRNGHRVVGGYTSITGQRAGLPPVRLYRRFTLQKIKADNTFDDSFDGNG